MTLTRREPDPTDVTVNLTKREFNTIRNHVEDMLQTAYRMSESHKHDPVWATEVDVCKGLMAKFGVEPERCTPVHDKAKRKRRSRR